MQLGEMRIGRMQLSEMRIGRMQLSEMRIGRKRFRRLLSVFTKFNSELQNTVKNSKNQIRMAF